LQEHNTEMYPLTHLEPVAEIVIHETHFGDHYFRPLSNDWNIAVIFMAFFQTASSLQC